MGRVVGLRLEKRPWLAYERAALSAMQNAFSAQGIEIDCEHGRAETGSPWTVFYDGRSGMFIAHVARHKQGYVLVWCDHTTIHIDDIHELPAIIRDTAFYYAQRSGT
jgi:hypothetical protein